MRKPKRLSERVIVIFRRWPPKDGGDVIALMPACPATVDGRFCTSYQHVGQHGAADYAGVVRATRPATPEEYAPLLRELRDACGYEDLVVRRRYTRRGGRGR